MFCPEGKVQKPLLPVGGTADRHSIVPVVYVSLFKCYGLLSWTLGAKKDFRCSDHVSGTSLYDERAALTENHCDGVSGETPVTMTCSID